MRAGGGARGGAAILCCIALLVPCAAWLAAQSADPAAGPLATPSPPALPLLPLLPPPAHAQGQDAGQSAPASAPPHPPPPFTAEYAGEFGYEGALHGRLDGPRGAAAAPDGRIAIADTGNDRIVVLDERGAHLRTFGTAGSGTGQFRGPTDVAFDQAGRIIVADRGNVRVAVFNADYTHAMTIDPDPKFATINGIAVGPGGDIIVAEYSADGGTVRVFDANGTHKRGAGAGGRLIDRAWDVAADHAGRIVVADRSLHLFKDGARTGGIDIGPANRPSVAADRFGRILVTDATRNDIRIYDAGLAAVSAVGGIGFMLNARVGVDSGGRILVAQPTSHSVLSLGPALEHVGSSGSGACGPRSAPLGVSPGANGSVVAAYGDGTLAEISVPGGACRAIPHAVAAMAPVGAVPHGDGGGRYAVADKGGGRVLILSPGPGGGAYEAREVDPPGFAGFDSPSGIAAAPGGRIVVSDDGGGGGGGGGGAVFVLREGGGGAWTASQIAAQGGGEGQVDRPGGVAVGPGPAIWVADTGNNRIQAFGMDGSHLRTVPGWGEGEFDAPVDVQVDAYGRIVAASAWGEIALLDGAGRVLDRLHILPNGSAVDAAAVAVTPEGYVAAADSASGGALILAFGADTGGMRTYASTGTDDGAFSLPAGVAAAPGGNIVVADTENDRVQVFSASALHLLSFGSGGTGRLGLDSPRGVAVGANGTIVVADTGNDRLQLFGPLGGHVRTVRGAGGINFSSPAGVAVGPNGTIFVADAGNGRVVELEAGGGPMIRAFGRDGPADGRLAEPVGVAVSPDGGTVFVADAGGAGVMAYAAGNGSALRSFDGREYGLVQPAGIAVVARTGCGGDGGRATAEDGWSLAVSDARGRQAHWFTPGGEHLCSGRHEFSGPLGVAPGGPVAAASGADAVLVVANTGGGSIDIVGPSGARISSLHQPAAAGDFTRRLMDVAANGSNGAVVLADADNDRIHAFDRAGNHLFSAGLRGSADGAFDSPEGIAIAPGGSPWPGRIAVADTGNGRVQVLGPGGGHLLTVGAGELDGPTSVAVDALGRILVADSGNARVVAFDGSGSGARIESLDRTDLGRYRSGPYGGPTDVAVGPGGEIVVADATAQQVRVYGAGGAHLRTFAAVLPGREALPYMRDVAVDALGRILVADANNHRIEAFSASGAHEETIGGRGSGADGTFQRLSGIDAGFRGRIVAADPEGWRVQAFDAPASHVATFGGAQGTGAPLAGGMDGPLGVASLPEPDGRLVVSDTGNGRLLLVDAGDGSAVPLGRRGAGGGEFTAPAGVAAGPNGTIVVADAGNGRIQLVDALSGEHVLSIRRAEWTGGANGSAAPQRVAVDGAGNIVVADGATVRAFNMSGAPAWSDAQSAFHIDVAADVFVDADGHANAVWHVPGSSGAFAVAYGPDGRELRTYGLDMLDTAGGPGSANPASAWYGASADSAGRIALASADGGIVGVHDRNGTLLREFGGPGSADGQLAGPRAVHIDGSGRIAVADTGNDRVQVFGGGGETLFAGAFSIRGSGEGRLSSPQGLAADPLGRYLVADTGNSRVQVFAADGAYERSFGSRGTAHANLASAAGVAAGPGGAIAVADTGNGRVKVFSEHGSHMLTIGGGGMLRRPLAVDIDAAGRIVVADAGSGRIEVLEPVPHGDPRGVGDEGPRLAGLAAPQGSDYAPSLAIGANGTGRVRLASPEGVAAGWPGRIVVADTGNDIVRVFNSSTGGHVMDVGGGGTEGAGGLSGPAGVEASRTGRIWVADTGNDRVVLYGPDGSLVGSFGTGGTGQGMFDAPRDIAYNAQSRELAVLDSGNGRVQVFRPAFSASNAGEAAARVVDGAAAVAARLRAASDAPAAADGAGTRADKLGSASDAPAVLDAASHRAARLASPPAGDAPAVLDAASHRAARAAAAMDAPSAADEASHRAARAAAAMDAPAVEEEVALRVGTIVGAADAPAAVDGAGTRADKLVAVSDSPAAADGASAAAARLASPPAGDAPAVLDAASHRAGRAAGAADAPAAADEASHRAGRAAAAMDAPSVEEGVALRAGTIVGAVDAPAVRSNATAPAGLRGSASDALAVSDGAFHMAGRVAAATDAPASADGATVQAERAAVVQDAPAVSDGAEAQAERAAGASDAPAVSDGASAAAARVISPPAGDAPAAADGAAALAGHAVGAQDAPAVSDGASHMAGRAAGAMDAPAVSDGAAVQAERAAGAQDAPAVSDGAEAQAERAAGAQDAPAVSDGAAAAAARVISPPAGDAPAAADGAAALAGHAVGASDAPAVSDGAFHMAGRVAAAMDVPAVSDGAEVQAERAAGAASDAPAVSDGAFHMAGRVAAAMDVPAVSDGAEVQAERAAGAASDAPAVSDGASVLLPGHPTPAADSPAVNDSAAVLAAFVRTLADAPAAADMAVADGAPAREGRNATKSPPMRAVGDNAKVSDAALLNEVSVRAADAPIHGAGAATSLGGAFFAAAHDVPRHFSLASVRAGVPSAPPPPAVVVAPPEPAPPAAQFERPVPGPLPPAAPSGAGGVPAERAESTVHGGSGGQLPAIVGISWNMCGSNADLYVHVRQATPLAYVVVESGTSGETAAIPSGARGHGQVVQWHARMEPHGGNVTAELRLASGVIFREYGGTLALGECAPGSGSGCYTVVDSAAFRMDRCRSEADLPAVPAADPAADPAALEAAEGAPLAAPPAAQQPRGEDRRTGIPAPEVEPHAEPPDGAPEAPARQGAAGNAGTGGDAPHATGAAAPRGAGHAAPHASALHPAADPADSATLLQAAIAAGIGAGCAALIAALVLSRRRPRGDR